METEPKNGKTVSPWTNGEGIGGRCSNCHLNYQQGKPHLALLQCLNELKKYIAYLHDTVDHAEQRLLQTRSEKNSMMRLALALLMKQPAQKLAIKKDDLEAIGNAGIKFEATKDGVLTFSAVLKAGEGKA